MSSGSIGRSSGPQPWDTYSKTDDDNLKVARVSSTDNAIVRFDGTSGLVQNSSVVIDDSGNVGVGTSSPSNLLHVSQASTDYQVRVTGTSAANAGSIRTYNVGGEATGFGTTGSSNAGYGANLGFIGTITNIPQIFLTNNTERMRIDTSGNVGIGVTPSGWSGMKSIDMIGTASFASDSTYNSLVLTNNGYSTDAGVSWKYKKTGGGASQYYQNSGNHVWRSTAVSGVADNTITWNQGMTLDSSGNLQFNSGYGSVATAYGCRAWVNFNGTGTVAIRASGNVSSITDGGTGRYLVNFTNAMPDINYTLSLSGQNRDANDDRNINGITERKGTQTSRNVSYVPIDTSGWFIGGYTGNTMDAELVNVAIFR